MSRGKYTCTWCEEDHVDGCVNLACPVGFHNVKSMSPSDLEGDFHPDPAEELHTKGYELGLVSAKEDIGPGLRKTAGERYAAGKDADAKLLRDLAETFEKAADKARSQYRAKYHDNKDEP